LACLLHAVESYLSLVVRTELKKTGCSHRVVLCFASGLFWTLIYCLLFKLQVEDVNAKFAALEKLKNNNWKEEERKTRKFIKKSKAKVLHCI